MAYTYDDFLTAAKSGGFLKGLSQTDLDTASKQPEYGRTLLRLMQDSAGAKTTEQKLLADEAVKQLRSSYGISAANNYGLPGYSAENQGKVAQLTAQAANYGSFNYDRQGAYDDALTAYTQQEAFSYDPDTDPSYSAYLKAYMREGERASANALAQAAAASGGQVSSYAMTAAQQAGNYYAGQAADRIPTLEQAALSRHQAEAARRQQILAALQSDRANAYSEWQSGYDRIQDSLSNYRALDDTAYQRGLTQYDLQYQAEQDRLDRAYRDEQARLAQEQQALENERTAQNTAYTNAFEMWKALGYATPEIAQTLGIQAGTRYSSGDSGDDGGSGSGITGYTDLEGRLESWQANGMPRGDSDAMELIKEALQDGTINQWQYQFLMARFG